MDVEVEELQRHLSRFLAEVQAGIELLITDHGRPIARVVPVCGDGPLRSGIDEGWIRPAGTNRPIGDRARHTSTRRIVDVVSNDRS